MPQKPGIPVGHGYRCCSINNYRKWWPGAVLTSLKSITRLEIRLEGAGSRRSEFFAEVVKMSSVETPVSMLHTHKVDETSSSAGFSNMSIPCRFACTLGYGRYRQRETQLCMRSLRGRNSTTCIGLDGSELVWSLDA